MKKASKILIPVIVFTFLFTTLMCCCIGKVAWASLSSKHSCCPSKKHDQRPGPQLNDYTKASCECPAKIAVNISSSASQFKSEIVFFAAKSVMPLALSAQDQAVDLSATGFSPHYYSQKFSPLPLYLKNSVYRI